MAQGTLNATYADGSSTSGAVLVPSWWSWPYPAGGDIIFGYYLTNTTTNYNRSNIFLTVNWLDSTKVLTSLTLPNVSAGAATSPGGAAVGTQLHIFSLSMLPITAEESSSPQLEVQYARSTRKFLNNNGTQVIEATIANTGDEFVLRNHSVTVSVDSPGLTTVQNATIKRLSPGDQAVVQIGVQVADGTTVGSSGNATVVINALGASAAEYTFNATYGIPDYEATYESIYEHESPDWYVKRINTRHILTHPGTMVQNMASSSTGASTRSPHGVIRARTKATRSGIG
jgi:alpha-L-fucosidase